VKCVATAHLPTQYGDFQMKVYMNTFDGKEHIALVKGEWHEGENILVRVHSECLTGDLFGSLRCDCGYQLHSAMQMIEKEGKGVLLYMRQEGRGIGLINKVKAYKLQEEGLDTVEANEELGFEPDPRDYGIGAQILVDLNVKNMRLITNNPKKRVGLESYGLNVVERIPLEAEPNSCNKNYLFTKKHKMGHILHNLE
jgi:3,4-dihydroxy 2-butanone 4-phosphate synthase/GTP cyclohydrolase II